MRKHMQKLHIFNFPRPTVSVWEEFTHISVGNCFFHIPFISKNIV